MSKSDNRPTLHVGQVSEHNNGAAAARMSCDDFDGLVSGAMQICYPPMGHWHPFWIPKEGDQTVMLRLPNGSQEGFIFGSQYTAANLPQNGSDGIILLVSDNAKNIIRLDALNGTMDVTFDQVCALKFKNLKLEVEETMDVKCKDINIEVEEQYYLKAKKTKSEIKETSKNKYGTDDPNWVDANDQHLYVYKTSVEGEHLPWP